MNLRLPHLSRRTTIAHRLEGFGGSFHPRKKFVGTPQEYPQRMRWLRGISRYSTKFDDHLVPESAAVLHDILALRSRSGGFQIRLENVTRSLLRSLDDGDPVDLESFYRTRTLAFMGREDLHKRFSELQSDGSFPLCVDVFGQDGQVIPITLTSYDVQTALVSYQDSQGRCFSMPLTIVYGAMTAQSSKNLNLGEDLFWGACEYSAGSLVTQYHEQPLGHAMGFTPNEDYPTPEQINATIEAHPVLKDRIPFRITTYNFQGPSPFLVMARLISQGLVPVGNEDLRYHDYDFHLFAWLAMPQHAFRAIQKKLQLLFTLYDDSILSQNANFSRFIENEINRVIEKIDFTVTADPVVKKGPYYTQDLQKHCKTMWSMSARNILDQILQADSQQPQFDFSRERVNAYHWFQDKISVADNYHYTMAGIKLSATERDRLQGISLQDWDDFSVLNDQDAASLAEIWKQRTQMNFSQVDAK